ncbi:ATP-binding protein [Nonomuraea sp. NPDC005983]|uniref:ATP-binding protein n=1 Tax=Nonomuraea sp. NPDC005983 TaxID=3155595 RepID=UPI0033B5EA17
MNPYSATAVLDHNVAHRSDRRDKAFSGYEFWDRLKAGFQRFNAPWEEPDEQVSSWVFAGKASSVPRARRITRSRLAAWGLGDRIEAAELLISELVTNALSHAHGPYRLTLSATDGLLRCEVSDADPTPPHLGEADLDDEHGRGLAVLDLLACCWGSEPTSEGKTVWFELPAHS